MKEFINDVKKDKKKYALYLFFAIIVFPFVALFLGSFLFSNGLEEKDIYNLNLQDFLILSPISIILQYILYKAFNKDSLKKRDKFLFNMMAILSCILYIVGLFIIFNSSMEIEFKFLASLILIIIPYNFCFIRDIVIRRINPCETTFFI